MQYLSHFDDKICHIEIVDFYSSIDSQKTKKNIIESQYTSLIESPLVVMMDFTIYQYFHRQSQKD